ncbi:MAG: hypothetical protein ACKV19_01655, partial [Verrucomicrobiales bacterium]
DIPTPRASLVSALIHSLDREAARGKLTLHSAPVLRRLPGGRSEVRCRLQDGSARPLDWQFELVLENDGWKALRLRMGSPL